MMLSNIMVLKNEVEKFILNFVSNCIKTVYILKISIKNNVHHK